MYPTCHLHGLPLDGNFQKPEDTGTTDAAHTRQGAGDGTARIHGHGEAGAQTTLQAAGVLLSASVCPQEDAQGQSGGWEPQASLGPGASPSGSAP